MAVLPHAYIYRSLFNSISSINLHSIFDLSQFNPSTIHIQSRQLPRLISDTSKMTNSLFEYRTQICNLRYITSLRCKPEDAYRILQRLATPGQFLGWHFHRIQNFDQQPEMASAVNVCEGASMALARALTKSRRLKSWTLGKRPDSGTNPELEALEIIREILTDLDAAFAAFSVVDTDPILAVHQQPPRLLIIEYLKIVMRSSVQISKILCPQFTAWYEYVEESIETQGLPDFRFDTMETHNSVQSYTVSRENLRSRNR